MTHHSRLIFPSVFLAMAAVVLSSCAPQQDEQSGICAAHRRGAALVTRYVVVYASLIASPATNMYYACLRPRGQRLDLGVDELGGVYGSDATTGGFRAAGTYVAAQSSTGEASLAVCARYSSTRRCTPAEHWLTVIDTRARRQVHMLIYASLPVPALVPFPVALALSPKGAVAWLQNSTIGASVTNRLQLWATALEPRGRSGFAAAPSMIDTGSIDRCCVRFNGLTLEWVRERERHHLKLP